MSILLKPTITTAGLQAVFNADSNGLNAKITHIGLGDVGYAPTQDRTSLSSEKSRVPIASGSMASPTQAHMTVMEDTENTFWVKEVGFFLEDGTLFAVYSDPDKVLAYKSPDVALILAFDLAITGVPSGAITIVDQGLDINILFAPELAKMGAAQINSNYRFLKMKFKMMEN
ncbi:MAG: hypothetical protein ACI8WB_001726 [Phenylobacterium sp.]